MDRPEPGNRSLGKECIRMDRMDRTERMERMDWMGWMEGMNRMDRMDKNASLLFPKVNTL